MFHDEHHSDAVSIVFFTSCLHALNTQSLSRAHSKTSWFQMNSYPHLHVTSAQGWPSGVSQTANLFSDVCVHDMMLHRDLPEGLASSTWLMLQLTPRGLRASNEGKSLTKNLNAQENLLKHICLSRKCKENKTWSLSVIRVTPLHLPTSHHWSIVSAQTFKVKGPGHI